MEDSAWGLVMDIIFLKMLEFPVISISAFILASQAISDTLPKFEIFFAPQ